MNGTRGFSAIALVLVSAGTLVWCATEASAQIYTRRNANGVVEATNVPDAVDFRLTYPGKGTLIHSRSFRHIAYDGRFDRHILDAASAFSLPADLIRAVIQVESEFDEYAVSSKGAKGLMQLMGPTARRFGVLDAFDPRQNIFGGAQYLRVLLDLFHGDLPLVLAAYNAGENAVLRYRGIPPYKETRAYVVKVQNAYDGPLPWASEPTPSGPARASFFAPASGAAPTPGTSANSGPRPRVAPARPAVYYRWTDERGVAHASHQPPIEGIVYSMIRALP